ncbi:spore protease YyaC [Aquisalibacillus elongatus]|uniref:Putative sporulation protein YyaC n=1 Tax=Aquisalibacillus elongatus TaxID=485577 RepID=A0A3N5B1A3_9BACI|nr:spore protease YyaC [Aquisalibacillus elongatus]RPF51124.1 putative sporulation protein YyaC [Aquisalibacillus elongatus]
MTSIKFNQSITTLHTDDRSFVHNLSETLHDNIPSNRPIIILCIGTDRSTGDSLGPLIGYMLKQKPIKDLHVYGTIDQPVHAKNLKETLDDIYETYQLPCIIAIDAALSSLPKVKSIDVEVGPLIPGAAVKKDIKPVGDLSIKGYVNIGGFMEFTILQNTRLSVVMKMAKQIAQALYYMDIKRKRNKSFVKIKTP